VNVERRDGQSVFEVLRPGKPTAAITSTCRTPQVLNALEQIRGSGPTRGGRRGIQRALAGFLASTGAATAPPRVAIGERRVTLVDESAPPDR